MAYGCKQTQKAPQNTMTAIQTGRPAAAPPARPRANAARTKKKLKSNSIPRASTRTTIPVSGRFHSAIGTGISRNAAAAIAARAHGPYGRYPKGPLSVEDKPGAAHRIASPGREALGSRLVAAFEHAHMLVFHPRDSAPPCLQALLDAGWSTTGIVVISQLVAFLSYQIRVVAGLRVLKSRPA